MLISIKTILVIPGPLSSFIKKIDTNANFEYYSTNGVFPHQKPEFQDIWYMNNGMKYKHLPTVISSSKQEI